jgi:hypothetical protein
MTFQFIRNVLSLAMLWSAAACAVAGAAPTFSPAQLREDLAQLRRALEEMPPDLSRSANIGELDREFRRIDAEIGVSAPLDRGAAWRLFARLNPILADGHLFVGFLDWRGDTRAHLAGGGTLFPFQVDVTPRCELSVHQDPGSAFLPGEAYARIRAVNGIPGNELCEQLMARVHGDTRVFRADLLSRRFWFFYWKLFGAPESYELTLEPGMPGGLEGTRRYSGNTRLPGLLDAEADFRRQFDLTLVADATGKDADTAILSLRTFAWRNKDEVLAFTRQSFESLKRWSIRTLIIDLRDNGGGNDDQWIEGVMPYIATKRWRTASTYRKRVITPDASKGEKVGDVVAGQIENWYEPQPQNSLHFGGTVYVAVGPGTYSSAVVMATVFQDFGLGKVIGSGNSVRASQSGGTRRTTLTHTGLVVIAPRFVLTRPSGAKQPVLLDPDIALGADQSLVDFAGGLP